MPPKSLKEIQRALLSNETTVVNLVHSYLEQIKKTQELNAFVEVFETEALQRAKELDEKLLQQPSQIGKLFGCVLSIKDLIVYKDHEANACSKILHGFKSLFDATAVKAILAEDAIIIGRTNCDEFGMGSANTNSAFGPVKNAIDPRKVSGGSSGGAAVSVQTNACLMALGTDTGGSVRQPASFCGVYGYKPSYGMVSRYGLIAYASSFDQIGIIAHDVEDIDLLMSVIAVPDEFDATMYQNVPYPSEKISIKKKLKFAFFNEAMENTALDGEIKTKLADSFIKIEEQGMEVKATNFSLLSYLVPCYYILTTAEASSNLSRYDGVRYGHRSNDSDQLASLYINTRTEGFSTEVKKRIMLGSFVLSASYYDTYYTKAQQVRQMIKKQLDTLFEAHDFILMPTAPNVAWTIGENPEDPMEIYMSDIYTVMANLAGLCALSIPIGSHTNGLPFGLQIIGKSKGDKHLLAAAQWLSNIFVG